MLALHCKQSFPLVSGTAGGNGGTSPMHKAALSGVPEQDKNNKFYDPPPKKNSAPHNPMPRREESLRALTPCGSSSWCEPYSNTSSFRATPDPASTPSGS